MNQHLLALVLDSDSSDLDSVFRCCSDIHSSPYKTGSGGPFFHQYRQHSTTFVVSHDSDNVNVNSNNNKTDPLHLYCQQQDSLCCSSSDSGSSTGDHINSNSKSNKSNTNMTDPLTTMSDNTTTNNNNSEEDLDALLAEADSMIAASGSGIVIDGFAIDSDDEGDDGAINDNEGIVDVSMESSPTEVPQQQQQQQQTMQATHDPLLHPLQEDMSAPPTTTTTTTTNSSTTSTTPTSGGHAFSAATVTSAMRNLGVTAADAATLESQFKAQTSRFAANVSSMAQRIARVTPTGGLILGSNTNSMMSASFEASNIPPPMSVPSPNNTNMIHNNNNTNNSHSWHGGAPTNAASGSPYSTTNSAHGNTSAAGAVSAGLPMMNFELDAEQKTTLVEWHVGKLLPGERVIMFLHNLLHVSDSHGCFQYLAQPGSSVVWCCAMTYYRLIVFGTTQEAMMHVMNSANNGATAPHAPKPNLLQHAAPSPITWNASCWPPAAATVMQMPLSTMEKVEKTVYTASPAASAVAVAIASNNLAAANNNAPGPSGRPTSLMGLQIWSKEGRIWRLTTPSYADTVRAHQALLTYAFPGRRNLGYLFAFESKRADVVNSIVTDPVTGQKTVSLALTRKRFDAVVEFQRQFQRGAPATTTTNNTLDNGNRPPTNPVQPWKIWTQINSQYQLCMSYPNVLVGPASLDENNPDAVRLLHACAQFRSEQRLPALAWSSGIDGASIWRCSQPKIGLQGNRSSADELVLKHIMEAAKSANALREQPLPVRMDPHLLQIFTGANGNDLNNTHWVRESQCALKILDLRPRSAAMANRTGGYGYENTSNYPGTTIQFCNIGNIHAVRDAYQKMTALCLNTSNSSDVTWGSSLEDTKWLSHIRIVLAASWETAFWVQVHRMPVLLHCSHGWDRTSQVSCLAQLMLDPYYRTLAGFACLVEKDFMSFGHPFHTRCAHGEGKGGDGGGGLSLQDASGKISTVGNSSAPDEGQISPIFLQFVDCVWQIVRQYPECFEFTTDYLLELSDHIYTCRFGNLLCDTERERELVAGIRQRTYSLWDHLEQDPNDPKNDPRAKLWRNPHYDPSPSAGGGVLLMPMPTLLRNVTLWREKYARYGPMATDRWRNTEQSLLWQPRPSTAIGSMS